jgi:hypothetical protein
MDVQMQRLVITKRVLPNLTAAALILDVLIQPFAALTLKQGAMTALVQKDMQLVWTLKPATMIV